MALELNNYTVKQIDNKTAKELIVEHHYTHIWSTGAYSLGLIKDGFVVGVAVYGFPVGMLVSQSISSEIKHGEVLELSRLWVSDSEGKNIESWFLGQTFSWLKKNIPQIKVLISYTDPTFGHIGIIYQATNWLYQGNDISGREYYTYKVGNRCLHPKTVFDKYGTNKIEKLKKLIPNFEVIPLQKKHRYIYLLGNKRDKKKILKTLKHPILPYVKLERTMSNDLVIGKNENKEAEKSIKQFFDFGD